ncbi:MAG TPA: methionyl-tRNA formyltransferase [Candidatus Faecousia intestinigallinarum]|nr:methionyl-tRNA formyltransferase [Candidatus Faecousia intestinigallinarum]
MRVVFMGTPEIAATCLHRILEDGYQVVGVFTQPDRPKNRGMKLTASPVKELAQKHGIPVFQPENFREEASVQQLRDLQPDVVAVVAYGRILPQKVLDVPKKGCINIHASLLPEYRGSAPYQWAVLDGKVETGVTAMYLVREMDAGDMIDAVKTPIDPNETAGELLSRLAELGAGLLSKTLGALERDAVTATPQDGSKATFAPMLDKSMSPIDWRKTAWQVHNHVRGLHPWPVATAEINGTRFKIHKTVVAEGSGAPGEILGLTKTGLRVACGQGAVEIQRLQADGGKPMAAADYFRGHPLEG